MNSVYATLLRREAAGTSVVQGPRIPEGTLVGLEAIAYLGEAWRCARSSGPRSPVSVP